jgi:hypothetical protein
MPRCTKRVGGMMRASSPRKCSPGGARARPKISGGAT